MRIHGGDRTARIDFSSNTNPLGPPSIVYEALERCLSSHTIDRYPDYNYTELRKTIAEFYRCSEDHIVPTAGASEAINIVIFAQNPKTIAVVEPSYGEYEDIAKALGLAYRPLFYGRDRSGFYLELHSLDDVCRDRDALIVITNPSNPLGVYVDRVKILDYLSSCTARALIDEAYIELCDRCPIHVEREAGENVVIVRSLTKWLSVPGLRIGFLYTTDTKLSRKIDTIRPPWNVNSLAECVAVEVLGRRDDVYRFIELSRRFIERERSWLSERLRELGLKVYNSAVNFLLAEIRYGDALVSYLKKRGIAVRSCASFRGLGPDFIRIAVRKRDENIELVETLRGLMSGWL